MSIGLLALLDDVAGIAKVAAASLDDIAGQAAKAGVKAAGAVIDDAAVTPRYVDGLDRALSRDLSAQLGREVDVQLREVVTADDASIAHQQATLSELSQSIAALQQAESDRGAAVRRPRSDSRTFWRLRVQ